MREGTQMQEELALPAFQMDCRDWLVITPEETGLPDEVGGTPLLAVLSTAVIDVEDFRSVSAVLTLGLLDEGSRPVSRWVAGWLRNWSTPTATTGRCATCCRPRMASWPCSRSSRRREPSTPRCIAG